MKYSDPDEVLRQAAGPAPWYIRAFPPNFEGFAWEDSCEVTDIGAMMLRKLDGSIVAIVGMYCYVLAANQDCFLIWYQGYDSEARNHRKQITFEFGSVRELQVLSDVPIALNRIKEKDEYLVLDDRTTSKFLFSTDLDPGTNRVDFPIWLKFTDELLLWGHCTSGTFKPQIGTNNNLCLVILRPKAGTAEIIPQDWFNNSETLDFGYQWVTRVARDPGSQRVYGEGIRLASFVLDDSLRNVEEWFGARTT